MALFNDGRISELSDLRAQETSVLDAANIEGIDLAVKLELAQREMAVELAAFLLQNAEGILSESASRSLSHVAVTEALQQWHVFRTLELTFRDLYHNQLNDRYGQKWREYGRMAGERARLLYETGVGIVFTPVPRAAAPEVETVPSAAAGATYFFRASWVGAAGAEGIPSSPAAFSTADGFSPRVTMAAGPSGVAGWHLYAGTSVEDTMRQTSVPLTMGAWWTLPAGGLATGAGPGSGQGPDTYIRRAQWSLRG